MIAGEASIAGGSPSFSMVLLGVVLAYSRQRMLW